MNETETSTNSENKDAEQEKILLEDVLNYSEKRTKELVRTNKKLEKKFTSYKHDIAELEQENIFLKNETNILHQKTINSKKNNEELRKKLSQTERSSKEHEQEKIISDEITESVTQKANRHDRRYVLSITLAVIVIAVIVPYSIYFMIPVGQEYEVSIAEPVTSGYIIQNLKGDTIDTWLSWRLTEGDIIHINVLDVSRYPEKTELIRDIILSTESIDIDDSLLHKGPKGQTSTYFIGWKGALEKSSEISTLFYIPSNLEVVKSSIGVGDITIRLTNTQSGDGYSGFTKSIVDETQNQILKSEITIFEVDTLSDVQFSIILRHEFGHALGLAHSSDPDDLMHPTITTNYPYISECDVDAITFLYDGGKSSQVICKK